MRDLPGHQVFIGVGSNVEPIAHLELAVAALGEHYGRLQLSGVYQNPPFGFEGDDFLNMVVGLWTAENLRSLIGFLAGIHQRVGRVSGEQKFGPRKVDLDLLLFGALVDPQARVPRADVLRYAFVLGPLAELAPDLKHPVTGVAMGHAWAEWVGGHQLRNLGSLEGLKGTHITGAAVRQR